MSVDMAVKVLDESINKLVLIKLKGGKTIRGSLLGFDQHMNLLLDQSEEVPSEGESKWVVLQGKKSTYDVVDVERTLFINVTTDVQVVDSQRLR
jgi:small nuclear ribonucleoprotein